LTIFFSNIIRQFYVITIIIKRTHFGKRFFCIFVEGGRPLAQQIVDGRRFAAAAGRGHVVQPLQHVVRPADSVRVVAGGRGRRSALVLRVVVVTVDSLLLFRRVRLAGGRGGRYGGQTGGHAGHGC